LGLKDKEARSGAFSCRGKTLNCTSIWKLMKKKQTQNASYVPRWIIRIGKLIEKFSVKGAAAWMRFFFKRPPKRKLKPEERSWRDKAETHALEVKSIGKKIKVYRWGNGGKKVLVIHGWGGHGTSLWKLIRRLVKEGYEVVSFDAPAHGQSPTRSTLMLEFIESIRAVDKAFGPFYAAVGHSMGGISALNAAGSHDFSPEKLVVVGIPDSIERIFYEFAAALGLSPEVAKINIDYLEDIYGMNIHKISGSHNAARLDIPVLIIHDKDDKEVPYTEAVNIAKHLKKGELVLTEGLGHRRIIRDPAILKKILDFLKNGKDHGEK